MGQPRRKSAFLTPPPIAREDVAAFRDLCTATFTAWRAAGGAVCLNLPPQVERQLFLIREYAPRSAETQRLKADFAVQLLTVKRLQMHPVCDAENISMSVLMDLVGRN